MQCLSTICKKCLFCNDLFSKNVKKINIHEGVISSSRRGITAYPRRLQFARPFQEEKMY